MKSLIDLRGKNAIVTGGSRGVGREVALQLAGAGANVGVSYHSRSSEAASVVSECKGLGVEAWAQGGDLADPTEAERLFERGDEEFQKLDIFVGNHGIWPPQDEPVAMLSNDRWNRRIDANLNSIFYTCRAAASRLNQHGRIVLVSSTAAQRGEAFHADYAATKGAMISLVKGLCIEVAPRGITVNAVAPGWIDTEMSASAFVSGERERITRSIPIGRIATAKDVAGPIVFLCSELARHITGEVININGGAVLPG